MVPSGFVRNYANICLMMDHQLLHEGIGRAFYSTMVGHEIVILHEYIKKTPKHQTKTYALLANDSKRYDYER